MRFRRRVSPTSLTPPRRSLARPLSDISPALHFPCPALPASPCLLYCRVVPVPTLFRGRVTLSTCSSTSDDPPFPDPPFSVPAAATSPRHISTVAHPRLFRPDLFERQNVLGTLILCERAREKERRREEKGLLFLKAETRTMRVLRVLRRTCSPVRDVMVGEGGRRSRGGKKR